MEQLRAELRSRNLSPSGVKKTLVKRLSFALQGIGLDTERGRDEEIQTDLQDKEVQTESFESEEERKGNFGFLLDDQLRVKTKSCRNGKMILQSV